MFEALYQSAKLRFGDSNASQSMGEWICVNTTIKKRPFTFTDYPFQKAIADDMHSNLSVKKCSQVGLALPLDTPLPTPSGWTTIGDVQEGDEIFDEAGRPTVITYKSPIYTDHICYDIEFDDGTVQRADAGHRWFVKVTRGPFNVQGVYEGKGRPSAAHGYAKEGVVNTEFLFENQHRTKFYIPLANSLELPDAVLPMDPYVYGSWLGDGTRYSATLTVGDQDISEVVELFACRGVELVPSSTLQYRIIRQYAVLRKMGVIGEAKRIPLIYQRASVAQRLELLRGLMDTDGSITTGGRASFHNTETGLIEDVKDLLHGLGYKTRTRWRTPDGKGFGGKKQIAEVSFVPDATPVFNLKRKMDRQATRIARPRFTANRTVVSVNLAETVPMQCLTVAAESHLFLAGRSHLITHNTEVQLRKYLAILTRSQSLSGIFSLPNEKMFTKIYNGRIKPILEADPVFNPPSSNKPTRSKDQIQIRDSFGYITSCTESDATSISADFLFHDELDLSPQEIIALYQSRLQGSDMRITQSFSTPSFTNFGIDKNYKLTDQREFVIKCEACNHVQIPRFTPEFVHVDSFHFEVESFTDLTSQDIAQLDLENCYVKCEKCHKRLDLSNADRREWVATYPSRLNFRGYQVRPFSTHRIKPDYMFRQLANYQERSFTRGFYNTVLGEEYTSADAKIQKADVEACMAKGTASIPDVSWDTPCYIGIDVGMTCYITVSYDDVDGWPHYVLYETIPAAFLVRRVEELLKIYNIVQGTIDRFPYTNEANELRDLTGGRIMPVQYRGNAALQPVFEPDTKVISHYSSNNTMALDRVQALISGRRIEISGYQGNRQVVIDQLTDMVRNDSPDQEDMGQWLKVSGNDHYMHSMAFNQLARRVGEHLFSTQGSTMHTSPSFFGEGFGSASKELGLVGGASMKSISRISRLG